MTSVLVVEDDATFRSSIARDLGLRGVDVRIAAGAEEAVDVLQSARFDVLLTDLRLGGRDGIDLLKRARTIAPGTRAILMSGFATARDYQRAIELGAVRVLCKPFTSAELMQAIEHARDCTTGYSGSVHGLSLIDVLQLYQFGRRSLVVVVVGTPGGRVILRDGAFVHAERGELTGEAALAALLAAESGVLRTETVPAEHPQTIERPPQAVLLDCLRLVDEGRAAATPAPVRDEHDDADLARARLRAYWKQVASEVTPSATLDTIGVELALGCSVRLTGVGDPEPWGEPLLGVVASLRAFADAPRGVAEASVGSLLLAVVWDEPARVALLLTDLATNPSASAWFRAFVGAVARGVLVSAVPSRVGT